MRRLRALVAASTLAVSVAAAPAQAGVLLDLVDPYGQSETPYSLSFVAEAASVTLSVGGYQVPASLSATNNVVALNGGGPNLLGQTWTFTPAPSGSLAAQGNDGSGVNKLLFAGVWEGSYDVFSQSFATTIGSTYTYSFLFSNELWAPAPSGFRVSVDGASATGAVPEPATWALMILGMACVGSALRRRRAAVTVSYA